MAQVPTSIHTASMLDCLDRMQAGDRAAADDLIRRTTRRYTKLAERMYKSFRNVTPLADTDDVFQDSWLRLLRTLRLIRPKNTREFYNLAAVHLRRHLIDLARRPRCRAPEHVPIHPAGSSSGLGVSEPGERLPDDFELWARFHEAVGELPVDQREVVELRFYHGWSIEKIAAEFGVNVRTIGRWWEKACIELRDRVGRDLPADKPDPS